MFKGDTKRGRWTVLLAEEDDDVRERLTDDLTTDGYRVIAVEDGLELLDYLELTDRYPTRVSPPSVIISDAELAGIDGLEACRRAAARRPAPPFILLARHGDANLFRDALAAGVTEVLDKPVAPGVLREAVALFVR